MYKVKSHLLAYTTFFFILMGLSTPLGAQVRLNINLDKNAIMIGDHLGLTINIAASPGISVQNIAYGDWADEGKLELLDIGELNTVAESPELILQQELLLTTFDTGYLRLPPLMLTYEMDGISDTIYSSNLSLLVNSMKVQDEAPITENKDIIKEKLNWRDILPYVLALVAIVLAGLFFWRRSTQKTPTVAAPPPPPPPAHETALNKLSVLEKQAIWEQGKIKQFQSELTYVLREYLENRYDIQALEATTPEITQQIKKIALASTTQQQLKSILDTADMVKFAKAQPPLTVHPEALSSVKAFVLETRAITPVDHESNTSEA